MPGWGECEAGSWGHGSGLTRCDLTNPESLTTWLSWLRTQQLLCLIIKIKREKWDWSTLASLALLQDDRKVVKWHKQKKWSSWGEGLGGRGRDKVSVSNTIENREMIGQGWKPLLQVNYNCSWTRIWPSIWKFHFIWTNLFFKGSIQLLRTDTLALW